MRRAFSLVEVILAVSLVGLIILFLLGLLPSSGFLVRQSEQQLAATALAQEILVELDSRPFPTLRAAVGTLTPSSPGPLGPLLAEQRLPDGTMLRPQVELRAVAPADRLVEALVTISWTTARRARSFRAVRRFSSVPR